MIQKLQDGFQRNTRWSRLLFSLILVITGIFYPICNRLAQESGNAIILKLPVDDLIPFVPVFIIPYCYWHLQIVMTLAFLILSSRTGRHLHRMVISLAVSDLIAAIIFLILPTRMIRPEIQSAGILSDLVRLIYTIDLPYNLFPSKHVIWAIILNRIWAATGPRRLWFQLLNHGGTLLIIASTVLIKQHYTPDILGGLAVALLSIWLGGTIVNFLFTFEI